MADAVNNNEFTIDIAGEDAAEVKAPRRTIFVDEEKGEPNFLFVGVNGYNYQIKRGVNVDVPEEVVEVLRNSVATRYVPSKDKETGAMTLIPQQHYIIPFRIIK